MWMSPGLFILTQGIGRQNAKLLLIHPGKSSHVHEPPAIGCFLYGGLPVIRAQQRVTKAFQSDGLEIVHW